MGSAGKMCRKRTFEAAMAQKYSTVPPEIVAEICAKTWHRFSVEMELESLAANAYKPQVAQVVQQQHQHQQIVHMQIDHDSPTVQEAKEHATSGKGAKSALTVVSLFISLHTQTALPVVVYTPMLSN